MRRRRFGHLGSSGGPHIGMLDMRVPACDQNKSDQLILGSGEVQINQAKFVQYLKEISLEDTFPASDAVAAVQPAPTHNLHGGSSMFCGNLVRRRTPNRNQCSTSLLQAANASLNAPSPGRPFSIATMARWPLLYTRSWPIRTTAPRTP
jgi:hypothetical protein